MTAVACSDAPASPLYSTSDKVSHYAYDPSFRLSPMVPTKNYATFGTTAPQPRSHSYGGYPLSKLYVKYVRRVWKRVTRAMRKPERASVLPDGFVLINNARLSAAARRKSVLLP